MFFKLQDFPVSYYTICFGNSPKEHITFNSLHVYLKMGSFFFFFSSQSILQDYIFTKYTLGNAEFMVYKVCNFYFLF